MRGVNLFGRRITGLSLPQPRHSPILATNLTDGSASSLVGIAADSVGKATLEAVALPVLHYLIQLGAPSNLTFVPFTSVADYVANVTNGYKTNNLETVPPGGLYITNESSMSVVSRRVEFSRVPDAFLGLSLVSNDPLWKYRYIHNLQIHLRCHCW